MPLGVKSLGLLLRWRRLQNNGLSPCNIIEATFWTPFTSPNTYHNVWQSYTSQPTHTYVPICNTVRKNLLSFFFTYQYSQYIHQSGRGTATQPVARFAKYITPPQSVWTSNDNNCLFPLHQYLQACWPTTDPTPTPVRNAVERRQCIVALRWRRPV